MALRINCAVILFVFANKQIIMALRQNNDRFVHIEWGKSNPAPGHRTDPSARLARETPGSDFCIFSHRNAAYAHGGQHGKRWVFRYREGVRNHRVRDICAKPEVRRTSFDFSNIGSCCDMRRLSLKFDNNGK